MYILITNAYFHKKSKIRYIYNSLKIMLKLSLLSSSVLSIFKLYKLCNPLKNSLTTSVARKLFPDVIAT